ncbi:MAG TPA: DUF3336 domain-containing protein, partial [Agitococcus sp.]|nr:DUF3336 domain-containing protein [Agitococcus sp.]
MSAHKQRLLQALSHANNYQEWLAIAQELDQLDGYLDWRASDGAAFFHENLIKEHIQKMQALRQSGDLQHLAVLLQESVYRHLGELNNPALYQYARSGTKYIVGQYLDEVEQVMRSLSQQKIPQMSEQQKLALFEQAERVYGRPALMLSGGAAFGIYHLGVTK